MSLTALSELTKQIPSIKHEKVLVGVAAADDAGVYHLTDNLALIQTVDIFAPVVDDPYDYGQIAAANSLSDVYAMGGRPVTALNIAGFSPRIVSVEIMADIIKGAVDKTNEADCPIIGGHTIEDTELKFGLSVTGVVAKDAFITNAGARAGDVLILTKPIGMGILTTALKAGKLEPETIRKITGIMSQLNKTASEVMLRYDVHAATDITGFGLLGHAYNLAKASHVSLVLQADAIPCLPEAHVKTREAGYIPGGTANNKQYLEKMVSFSESIDAVEQMIYYDAQTSGGLLIAVRPAQADDMLHELRENNLEYAQIVGHVVQQKEKSIRCVR